MLLQFIPAFFVPSPSLQSSVLQDEQAQLPQLLLTWQVLQCWLIPRILTVISAGSVGCWLMLILLPAQWVALLQHCSCGRMKAPG